MIFTKIVIMNFQKKNTKIVTYYQDLFQIIDPHIKVDNNYYIYKEGKENDVFVKKPDGGEFNGWCWPGNSAYVDYLSPSAREW